MILSSTFAAIGDLDAAVDLLARAYRERDLLPALNYWQLFIEGFRQDPRCAAIMQKLMADALAPDLLAVLGRE